MNALRILRDLTLGFVIASFYALVLWLGLAATP